MLVKLEEVLWHARGIKRLAASDDDGRRDRGRVAQLLEGLDARAVGQPQLVRE